MVKKKERPFKCGFVPKDYNEIKKNYEDFAKPFNCKKGERIASVGASNGAIEAQISVFIDSINWTIQDIDSSCLNRKNLDKVLYYHEKLKGQPISGNFEIVLGVDNETKLKRDSFDRILLSNVYHELSDSKSILQDLHGALNQNGLLVIMERKAKKIGEKRKDCGHVMIWEPTFLAEMKELGFPIISKEDVEKYRDTYYTFKTNK